MSLHSRSLHSHGSDQRHTLELETTFLFNVNLFNLLFRLMLKLKKCGLLSLPGLRLFLVEGLGGIPNGPVNNFIDEKYDRFGAFSNIKGKKFTAKSHCDLVSTLC